MVSNINRHFSAFKLIFLIAIFFTYHKAAVADPADTSALLPDMTALDKQVQDGYSDSLNTVVNHLDFVESIEESKSRIAWQQYHRENLTHRKNTFNWQYSSGIVIFYIVILVVLSGILYSGIQFYQSVREMRMREAIIREREAVNLLIAREMMAKRTITEEKEDILAHTSPLMTVTDAKTELELSAKGVKLNSSLVGVIILVISVAFFYLYLIYVYPIDQMKIDVEQQRQEMIKAKEEAKTE